jgi:hypothetical protein
VIFGVLEATVGNERDDVAGLAITWEATDRVYEMKKKTARCANGDRPAQAASLSGRDSLSHKKGNTFVMAEATLTADSYRGPAYST